MNEYKCICGSIFESIKKLTGHQGTCYKYLQYKKQKKLEYDSKCNIECQLCHKKFMNNYSLKAHLSHCKLYIKPIKHIKYEQFRQPDGSFKCKCGKIFLDSSKLCGHLSWCGKDKQQKIKNLNIIGKSSWNKGLTIKDPRILKGTTKVKEGYKSGRIIPVWTRKTVPQYMKDSMKLGALKRKIPRTTKRTENYICKDGTIVRLDSSYERNLATILDKNNIKWIRPKPLDWYSKDGIKHHYFPDFYLIDYNIYLDPKNEYCFIDQKEKIDYILSNYKRCYFLHKEQINIDYINKIIGEVCELVKQTDY